MSNNSPDIQELKAIVDWVRLTGDVREISVKYGDIELFMSRNHAPTGAVSASTAPPAPAAAPGVPAAAPAVSAPAAPAAPAAAAPEAAAPAAVPAAGAGVGHELAADEVFVTAPMVGTFYSSPQPGAPAFVSVGDSVSADSVLGIVEVMKLMNNIEAKIDGTVTRILVENEQAVEYSQPLMVIRRNA